MTVPADWVGFAEVIGSASGALTGLLFVSVSLNATRIAGHQGLRSSAAQTLVLFLTPLFMAAALLAPGQDDQVLGGELIAIGTIMSGVLLANGRRKRWQPDDDLLIALFNHRYPNVIVMLLFVASGIALACGANDGLYLLLPASLVAFSSGVLNAWYFLLPPPDAVVAGDAKRRDRSE
jgi:hypothetical protein